MALPALVAAAAPAVIGGIASYFGQQETNAANAKLAVWQTRENQAEAARNRKWQEQMSNSAHQREANDLQTAGLNRLLTATGGASTPSGGQGQAAGATMENSLKAGITTAFEAKQLGMQIERQEKELQNLAAQTRKLNIDAKVAEKRIPESDLKTKFTTNFSPVIDRVINLEDSNGPRLSNLREEKKPNQMPLKNGKLNT
ncbi:minor capsid protein [Bdellovibrio phage phiMH2K]|uniref:Minor spike protein H n=1 Tax=Bdellovibrio phage phiMH2K TaxID=145579 RepID=H_BPPHM|nr:minor capsid protein [Bdellovibrio phage phiMH2K]Q9G055.1 RecName: Full=Minor spike protein H; AltName: Full=H protein; AltName: Full=Pilot protein; AltName: Full=Protein VP2; Short=VP2 [Bdellovibrio phage phiMH2K]AAG45344.1 Vp2 [Bdellovibrio phage phiMH2K]